MTNFEKVLPKFEELFGGGFNPSGLAHFYADCMADFDCANEQGCVVAKAIGHDGCQHRMGMTALSEIDRNDENAIEEWYCEEGNGKIRERSGIQ